jgi:hypothetical protein
MTKSKLDKIRRELRQMRLHPQGRGASELISLAKKLGRTPSKRGKEPTYIRDGEPALAPPLSIPNHPGDMKVKTVQSIVDQLLDDADEWELHLMDEDEEDEDGS